MVSWLRRSVCTPCARGCPSSHRWRSNLSNVYPADMRPAVQTPASISDYFCVSNDWDSGEQWSLSPPVLNAQIFKNKWAELQLSIMGFLKVRQTDALRQFNFISACWNWYGIKKMPACGWVSAEWREGRRLPRPVLWREQFSIPDRGLALYPQNMGKLLRRRLPHPHIHSPPCTPSLCPSR